MAMLRVIGLSLLLLAFVPAIILLRQRRAVLTPAGQAAWIAHLDRLGPERP